MEPKRLNTHCPVPGYSLPPPQSIGPSPPSSCILSVSHDYPWYNDTTFTIKASIGNLPAIEYAHRARRRSTISTEETSRKAESQKPLGASPPYEPLFDTKFRIASTTKLFTVLAVLLSKDKISWDDPITKHVPELDESIYGEVTIGSLADHTSGLGRFGYVGDLAFIPGFNPAMLGIKPAENTLPGVDLFPGGQVATPKQVIDMFNNPSYAASSPNSSPLYSNIAYNLLGMALATAHSKPFEQIIHDLILEPLGMNNSNFETPKSDHKAILPKQGEQWFAAPFGNFNPSGGLWSTPNDMLHFLQAILNHRLLSPAATRKWLQLTSFLPSLQQALGAAWEILRPTDLDIAFPRPIDIYTKPGGVAGYASHAILIPEYGTVATINAAGNAAGDAIKDLLPLVVKPLVASADQLVRSQALRKYAGTYKGEDGSNSTLTLALDDGPGLHIAALVMDGVPVLNALAALQNIKFDGGKASARLYPSDVDSLGTQREKWRIQLDRAREGNERGWLDLDRASWNWGDAMRYVGAPLDAALFEMDGNKEKAIAIEFLGWRITLKRGEEEAKSA